MKILTNEEIKKLEPLINSKMFDDFIKWLSSELEEIKVELIYSSEDHQVVRGKALQLIDIIESINQIRKLSER